MKNLMDIILDGDQIFEYRIKFAFQPTEKHVTRIEQMLGKYDLHEAQPLKRTIFQSRPTDFENLGAGEIWMLDVTLGRALQPEITRIEIGALLKMPDSYIHVRNMAEPLQEYVTAEEDGDIDFDEEYTPKLLDPDYSDAAPVDKSDYMGDALADKVVAAAKADYAKDRTPYADYMVAGYEAMYQKAASDVAQDKGPTKE